MIGLEKIVAAILEDAHAEAKATLEQAQVEAERILLEEKAKSDALCTQIEESARQQAEDIARAGAASSALQRRRRLLETKQDILAHTMEQALERLYALPEPAYFELLIKMAAVFAERKQGDLLLCEEDLRRLPVGFQENLRRALPEGAALSVSDQTRPVVGGFILRYGEIEQNCSFRAIFDARRDELTDSIRGILFS